MTENSNFHQNKLISIKINKLYQKNSAYFFLNQTISRNKNIQIKCDSSFERQFLKFIIN